MQGARLNAEINLRSIKDEAFVTEGRTTIGSAFDGAADAIAVVDRAVAERG